MEELMKDYTNILGICIPLYNKKELLRDSLERMHSVFYKNHLVPLHIYITDNNSTDGFSDEIELITKKYPNVSIYKNIENIGADRNFEKVLKLCEAKYAWLMGADDTINNNIVALLDYLSNHEHEFVIINSSKERGVYKDSDYVLRNLAYEPCWMSSDIFLTKTLSSLCFSRFYDTLWSQVGVILDFFSNNDAELCIINEKYSYALEDASNWWSDSIASIYLEKWMNMILSLNGYSIEQKEDCFKIGVEKGIMNNMWLLSLRAKNVYNRRFLKEKYVYLRRYNNSPYFILFAIAILPVRLLGLLRNTYIMLFLKKS